MWGALVTLYFDDLIATDISAPPSSLFQWGAVLPSNFKEPAIFTNLFGLELEE